MLENYAFMSKSYLCKNLSMLYDSNGFKPYIYVFFKNLSMCHTYIYSIGPTPKSIEYQFFGQFPKFSELLRQFSPDMSRSRVSTYIYIYRRLSTTLNPNLAKPLSSLSLAVAKALPR
jgi:hypothetical protein